MCRDQFFRAHGVPVTSQNLAMSKASGFSEPKWFSSQAPLKSSLQPPSPSTSFLSKVESHFKGKRVRKTSARRPKSKQAGEKLLDVAAWSRCIFNSISLWFKEGTPAPKLKKNNQPTNIPKKTDSNNDSSEIASPCCSSSPVVARDAAAQALSQQSKL